MVGAWRTKNQSVTENLKRLRCMRDFWCKSSNNRRGNGNKDLKLKLFKDSGIMFSWVRMNVRLKPSTIKERHRLTTFSKTLKTKLKQRNLKRSKTLRTPSKKKILKIALGCIIRNLLNNVSTVIKKTSKMQLYGLWPLTSIQLETMVI